MNASVAVTEEPSLQKVEKRTEFFGRRTLFVITLAVAALIYSQFEFMSVPERGDRANWDYMAQCIARGAVPYRDVVNIKSPLSAYIGAAAIVVTRPFGLQDVIAIRSIYFILAVLTVGFTFLVTDDYFSNRLTALLAATIMLTFNSFATLNCGIQPKTVMVLFGLMSLWAIKRDCPVEAGIYGMLSALSWQPGLLFVGAAGLAFSHYLTSWRDLKVVKLLSGAAIPLLILVVYLGIAGALKASFLWTIHFNYAVYGPREVRPISGFFYWFNQLLSRPYRQERIYFYVAAAGFLIAIAKEVWVGARNGIRYCLDAAPRHAILIAPLVYFMFCMVDIQGGADLIPLLPFVGVFAAVAFSIGLSVLLAGVRRLKPAMTTTPIEYAAFVAVLAAVFVFSVADAFKFHRGFPTLKDQYEGVKELTERLEPGDKIFTHGQTEVLVLSGLTNASKYFFLDRGKDMYLNKVEPGGYEGWLARLKAERPRVVALSRLRAVDHGNDFRQWMRDDYQRYDGTVFSFYVRKD